MPLYLVATPIGNLEDLSMRALRVLREVDLIACEDTRHTRRLLDRYSITRPTISYHEHNERTRAEELVERLVQGQSIALVSDAGMPGISDPAYRIVTAAIARGVKVVPIPGPNALITGLVASGLPTDSFLFAGFLPPKQIARRAQLTALSSISVTLIFYEAPHRIRETLADARDILGNRPAAIARELTKLHEEFIRGNLSELIAHFQTHEPRGEMTLVIAGASEDNLMAGDSGSLVAHVERLMGENGLSRNEALKRAARARGISKKAAYQLLLGEQKHAAVDGETGDENED